jgi:uncharacterized membrane protein
VFFIILLWCAGFSSIQLFPGNNILSAFFPFIKYNYSLVCHQQEAKSFLVNGIHFFVCARCTGIYTGALVFSFIFIFLKISPVIRLKAALISCIPAIADIILYNFGAYNYSKITAFVTGLFPGSVLFIYILCSFENFFEELKFINE